MKNVAPYARSSNDAHDVSCESQIREFMDLVEKNGENVVAVEREKGVSHFDAQGFVKLLDMAESALPPQIDKIYVYDTGRLSRDQYTLLSLLRRARQGCRSRHHQAAENGK